MSRKIFNFREQLARGEAFETILDALFSQFYAFEKVTMSEQRLGYDRVFTDSEGRRFKVEYKADERAEDTENFYVETVSVEKSGEVEAFGWVDKTQSDFVVLLLPQRARIFVLNSLALKAQVRRWEREYKMKTCKNEEYISKGVCVPIEKEIEPLADVVFDISLVRVK